MFPCAWVGKICFLMLYWSIWSLNEFKRVLHPNAQLNHMSMHGVLSRSPPHYSLKSNDTFTAFFSLRLCFTADGFLVQALSSNVASSITKRNLDVSPFPFLRIEKVPFQSQYKIKSDFCSICGRVHSFACVRVHSLNLPLVRAKYVVRVSWSRKSYHTSSYPNCTSFWSLQSHLNCRTFYFLIWLWLWYSNSAPRQFQQELVLLFILHEIKENVRTLNVA
jgi:hypothetical protein